MLLLRKVGSQFRAHQSNLPPPAARTNHFRGKKSTFKEKPDQNTQNTLCLVSPPPAPTRLIFPGGGLFFYWQAGAISYLRKHGYDLSHKNENVLFSGSSAGAIAATLTATNVDFEKATSVALELSREVGLWDRPLGLCATWGGLIERWLWEVLPADAAEKVQNKLFVLITHVPSFGKNLVSQFSDKEDLIKCNMASIHLPWFLDMRPTRQYRHHMYIDGSLWSTEQDYLPQQSQPQPQLLSAPLQYEHHSNNHSHTHVEASATTPILWMDYKKDPIMREQSRDWLRLTSEDGIRFLMERGQWYAQKMEECGALDSLLQKRS